MQAPKIRTARATDRSDVLGLWLDLIEYHRRLDPAYPAPAGIRGVLASEIERGLSAGNCRLGVAECDTGIGGFVFAEAQKQDKPGTGELPTGWIHELYVDPGQRRLGIASALLALADAFFRDRGTERVSVRVESGNDSGLRFWRHRGFADHEYILTRDT